VFSEGKEHIDWEVLQSKSATEKSSNGLLKSCVGLFHNSYTEILIVAGAACHADVIGPLDVELTVKVYVLEIGDAIRNLFLELNTVIKSPDLVMSRMKAGQPIVDMTWSKSDGHVSAKRYKAHNGMVDILRERLLSTPDSFCTPIVFGLIGIRDNLSQNFADYLDGGQFHPNVLTDAQVYILEKTKVYNHNMPAERAFGQADQIYSKLSPTTQTPTVGALVIGGSAGNDTFGEIDQKTAIEVDELIDNARNKRTLMKAVFKRDHTATEDARRKRKKDDAENGHKKRLKRIDAAFDIQTRSDLRPTTVAQLDADLAAIAGVPSKQLARIKHLLQVYRSPIWSGRLVKPEADSVPLQLAAVRSGGFKLTALSADGVYFDRETLTRNLQLLTKLCGGLKTLTPGEANVEGKLKRDTRTALDLSPKEATEKGLASSILQRNRKGKEGNRARCNGSRARVQAASEAPVVWRATEDKVAGRTYYWNVVKRQGQWEHPNVPVLWGTSKTPTLQKP
jgi:hypothetical protein